MRKVKDIQEAEKEFFDRVWYDRSMSLVGAVLDGKTEMPPEDIMDGAGEARAKVERQYGVESLGPYTEFEWGVINGKLSALRWVMGEDWDMLDT